MIREKHKSKEQESGVAKFSFSITYTFHDWYYYRTCTLYISGIIFVFYKYNPYKIAKIEQRGSSTSQWYGTTKEN